MEEIENKINTKDIIRNKNSTNLDLNCMDSPKDLTSTKQNNNTKIPYTVSKIDSIPTESINKL